MQSAVCDEPETLLSTDSFQHIYGSQIYGQLMCLMEGRAHQGRIQK